MGRRRTSSVTTPHYLLYDTLVTVDRRSGEFIPLLADSWSEEVRVTVDVELVAPVTVPA